MRFFRIAAVAVVAGLVLSACSGGDSPADETTTEAPTSTSSSAAPTETGTETTAPSTELTLTAPVGSSNTGFTETALSAPADTPFTIVFKNDDTGIPHNVQIFEGTATTGTPVFAPANNELINGVAETVYEVPALAAGSYTYNCFAHPATMVGTLTVA